MSTGQSDLRFGNVHLKEAADGLVTQVVEVKVRAAGSPAYAFPGQPEGVGGHWAHPVCDPDQPPENLSGLVGKDHVSRWPSRTSDPYDVNGVL
jgi:hypothetical protein